MQGVSSAGGKASGFSLPRRARRQDAGVVSELFPPCPPAAPPVARAPERPLAAWPAVGNVRWLLWAECLLFVCAILAYSLFALPSRRAPPIVAILFFAFAIAFPVLVNRLHGDGPREGGIRLDNVVASLREVVPVLLLLLGGVALVGWAVDGWHADLPGRTLRRAGRYLLYGPAQQYLLLGFLLRRLLQTGLASPRAIAVSAALFALVHLPNWPLVAVTFVLGLVSGTLFLRRPNIFVLGLMHGTLAVLIRLAWPESWMQALTIGGNWLERTGNLPGP